MQIFLKKPVPTGIIVLYTHYNAKIHSKAIWNVYNKSSNTGLF